LDLLIGGIVYPGDGYREFCKYFIGSSSARMKEIGVEKCWGTKELIIQFLTESMILVDCHCRRSAALPAGQTAFEKMVGKSIPALHDFPDVCTHSLLIIVLIGLRWLYPAFILSSMKSVDSLKETENCEGKYFLRKGLVGFNFV
jgi:hypothetical protein